MRGGRRPRQDPSAAPLQGHWFRRRTPATLPCEPVASPLRPPPMPALAFGMPEGGSQDGLKQNTGQ